MSSFLIRFPINLGNEKARDNCCAEGHKGDYGTLEECAGKWKYLSGMKKCQYVCEWNLPVCTEEAKLCPNSEKAVVRNASKECEFDDCG